MGQVSDAFDRSNRSNPGRREKFGNVDEIFLNLNDIETLNLATNLAGGY
jgi:hypothetical protein